MRKRLGERERQEIIASSDLLRLNHDSSLLAAEPKDNPNYGGYWADISVDLSVDPNGSKMILDGQ